MLHHSTLGPNLIKKKKEKKVVHPGVVCGLESVKVRCLPFVLISGFGFQKIQKKMIRMD